MTKLYLSSLALLSSFFLLHVSAQQCGSAVDGKVCANNLCCSQYGYCGSTADYCCKGCQSQCNCNVPPPPPYVPPPPPSPPPPSPPPTPTDQGVATIVTEELFNELLLHRATSPCLGAFYTYDAFLNAASKYPEFGMTGSDEDRKREIAAFFGQTSHETTGGWDSAPDGRYAWGYCWIREGATTPKEQLGYYCIESTQWPCASGKKYYGRGPIQLSYNANYGQAGEALGYNLLGDPDLVEDNPYISFAAAFWFWMTPQSPKPSCHDVMIGNFTPSAADIAARRFPGYGLCTNIINGGVECGGAQPKEEDLDRVGFFQRFAEILGVGVGDNLTCANMQPYGNGLSLDDSRAKLASLTGMAAAATVLLE